MESSIPPTLTSICYVRLVVYCLRRLASGHARVFRIWRWTTLGFLSFPSQQHFTRARCPCLGWSHHASMCLPVCPLVRVSFSFHFLFLTPFFCFQNFCFLSFPSQRPSSPVTRCACLGWSRYASFASICLPVCPLVMGLSLFLFYFSHLFLFS